MIGDLRQVYDVANRNNTAIYALDPRGLAPFEFDIDEGVGDSRVDSASLRMTQDTLRMLSDETDGRAIVNQNDSARACKQIVSDSSAYYLIGYNSSQAPQDGKFHEIKVKVKRSGVQVRAPQGILGADAGRVGSRAGAADARSAEGRRDGAGVDQPRPAARGRCDPHLGGDGARRERQDAHHLRVGAGSAAAGVRREEAARVSVTAMAPDGSAYFRGRVPDVMIASAAGSQAAGTAGGAPTSRAPAQVVFDAPPGPMQLRYAIENANAGVIDTDVREIAVPDLTAPQVQLSTPRVLRARTVKEFRELSADPHAVPSASREFRRTDRLVIRFDAYAPAGTPGVTAKLLNRGGQAMLDVPVSTQSTGATHQIDLPLASMAPAEYLIEIKAAGRGGRGQAVDRVSPRELKLLG